MITWEIKFTLSKILGFLIFIIGCIYAFYFQDSTVLISMTGVGAGLLGLHQWNDTQLSKIDKSQIINSKDSKDKVTQKPMDDIG